MTPARIREAAKVLRDAAEKATKATGASDWFETLSGRVRSSGGVVSESPWNEVNAYIALMSPPVALALADWLDDLANGDESGNDLHWPHPRDTKHALTLADTILGGKS